MATLLVGIHGQTGMAEQKTIHEWNTLFTGCVNGGSANIYIYIYIYIYVQKQNRQVEALDGNLAQSCSKSVKKSFFLILLQFF